MTETSFQPILTLQELADYLRLPCEEVEQAVEAGQIPGRKIGDHWRFLKPAIDGWLGGGPGGLRPVKSPAEAVEALLSRLTANAQPLGVSDLSTRHEAYASSVEE